MEKAIKVIMEYLKDVNEKYEIWLNEYDRTGSQISEDKTTEYRLQIILLESILNDIRK